MSYRLTLQSASGTAREWRGTAANDALAIRRASRELSEREPHLTGWRPLDIQRG